MGGAPVSVGVAMATRNGSRFIREQVASILEQSRAVDEIVVSDDASVDGTVDLIREMVASTSIPLIVRENSTPLGVTANFAQALRTSTADVVLLSDQDDIWATGRVAWAVEALAHVSAPAAVFGDARLIDVDGIPSGVNLFRSLEISGPTLDRIESGAAFPELLRRNLATGATMAVTRSLLDVATPFPEEWLHDEWLAILAAAVGHLLIDQRNVIDYRQHDANVIGAAPRNILHKADRVLRARGERNRTLATRAVRLAERLDELDASEDVRLAVREKFRFEKARAGLPRARLMRIPGIIRLGRAAGYDRFASQRKLDMLRDLLSAP